MKQILCLSNTPWSTSPGRTQQLISRLKDTQVLYFSPPQSRRDHSYKEKGQPVRPNVTAYTLPPLFFGQNDRTGPLFRMGQNKLSRFIEDKAHRHRFRSPLLWTSHPAHIHLLDHLDYSGLIYDCDRVWEDLPPIWEGSLAHAADLVFTASNRLAEQLSPCSSNIAVLENGVNYPLFANESNELRPNPLPGISGPVFGWAGTIRRDLDLSPILIAARAYPEWTFLLLGRRGNHPLLPRLRALPNVILAGPCSLTEVPDWLYRCDVLLELLRDDRIDDGVVPRRLYEYLCTGKPIVSMLWPDQVEHFPDVVYGAHNNEEFLDACQRALDEAPGFVSQRRLTHARAAAWPNRAAQVSQILDTAGLL